MNRSVPSTLAPTDRAFFDEHGYWVSPVLFDRDTMRQAREHARAVCDGVHETGRPPFSDVGHEPGALRKIDQAWWSDRTIASIATSPVLGDIAAALLGVEVIRLWHDQLLWKPPGGGASGVVGYHQDKGYWTASSTSDMVTAWVAFDDVTEEMGAMRFVPGSHRWGRVIEGNAFFETDHDAQRAAAKVPDGAEWTEQVVELEAGQVSFHHCKTLHGSPPNRSDRDRVSLAVHLMSGDAHRVPGKWHANCTFTTVAEGEPWDGPDFPTLHPTPVA